MKLLTVAVDRLPKWHRPGLLCIGDSAHAMSPVGGVGINLAIQDSIATANLLSEVLRGNEPVTDEDLARVQTRREWPVKATQAMQVFIQKNVISRVLGGTGKIKPPWMVKLFIHVPLLRRLPAAAHRDRRAAGAGDVTGAGRGSFRLRTSAVRLIWTFAERLIFQPSDLSDFTPQSDKTVSRETFWYD